MLLRSRPLIIAIAIDLVCGSASGVTKYVNWAATGNGDGDTWPNAYTSLETAIALASLPNSPITEIWVAQGTYKPTHLLDPAVPRSMTFRMVSGVAFYAGFLGTESDKNQRNHLENSTILSGDTLGNDGPNFTNRSDNAFHVVTAIRTLTVSGRDAILDGFIIRGGDAIGAPSTDPANFAAPEAGGGIQILANFGTSSLSRTAPKLVRCIFEDNRAVKGAAAYARAGGETSSAIDFRNCIFRFNRATDGAGFYNGGIPGEQFGKNEARIFNCLFHDNYATGIGAAIYVANFPGMNLYSSTIVRNFSDGDVGAVYKANSPPPANSEGDAVISNCIIYDNLRFNASTPVNDQLAQLKYQQDVFAKVTFCCIKDYVNGSGDSNNITTSPQFVSAALADFRVACTSPCLNMGSNAEPLSNVNDKYDLNQNTNTTERNPESNLHPRIASSVIDMGAYESPVCLADINYTGVVDIDDLTAVILQWGSTCPCSADIALCGGDGVVDINDLTAVILAWGNCPSGFAGGGAGGGNSMMAGGDDAAADESAGESQTIHDALLQLLADGTLSPEQFSEIVEAGLFP